MKYASDRNSVVAIFETHSQTEKTIKELQRCGHDMRNVSIAGQDLQPGAQAVGYYLSGGRMKRFGNTGTVWATSWSLLHGSGYFALPEIGPVLVAGPLVSWMVGELEKGVRSGEVGSIGAGLQRICVPNESIGQYEHAIRSGKLLLLAHGTLPEVERAKLIVESMHPETIWMHAFQQPVAELVAMP
jgi:hypothetical protein